MTDDITTCPQCGHNVNTATLRTCDNCNEQACHDCMNEDNDICYLCEYRLNHHF